MIARFVLILALAAWADGAPDFSASVRAELQTRYRAAARAFKKRDVPGLMEITSADLSSRRPDGQHWNRNQLQVYMNLALAALKTIDRADFRVIKVSLKGSEAIAIVDHTVAGTLNGGDGKPRKIVDVSTDRDVWIKTAVGWKIKFTECLKENVTIDGKRVKPTPAMASPSGKTSKRALAP